MQFVQKPVVVEAWQWFKHGDVPEIETHPIECDTVWKCPVCGYLDHEHNNCPTSEGWRIVCPGDWIVKGVKGDFYPYNSELFNLLYDKFTND